MLIRLLPLLLIAYASQSGAVVVKYVLALNHSDSTVGAIRTTAYPNGNAPLNAGASCSTWTCADIGDSASEIDEDSATQVSFSANSTNTFHPALAYQNALDTGSIQIKAKIPASYTGYTDDDFTAFGVTIREGTANGDYFATCWCPQGGGVRFTTGTASSNSTAVGALESCFSKHLTLTYTANALACFASTDDTAWTQTGTSVSKTLACTGDNCPTGVFGTSSDSGQTSFATLTEIALSTTITVPGEGGPEPEPDPQNLLWTGSVEGGTFVNFDVDPDNLTFHGTPAYGRPVQYGGQNVNHVGNGDLMWLTSATASGNFLAGPRRGSNTHSIGMHVKSSAGGGSEVNNKDCDGSVCTRRKTELRSWRVHWAGDMMPEHAERWAAMSVYIPSNYDTSSSVSGFDPLYFQFKMEQNNSKSSPPFAIAIDNGKWKITHRNHPTDGAPDSPTAPYVFRFTPTSPSSSDSFSDGLKFFPNTTASRAALSNLNKGGWTDFVINLRPDGRTVAEGGSGFLKLYMRPEGGSWTYVLNLFPDSTTNAGSTVNHGILYEGTNSQARYGFTPTMYMGKNQVWNLPGDGRTVYFDNLRVGDANATCVDMTHDGSDCTQ